jgi:hypothetical protein
MRPVIAEPPLYPEILAAFPAAKSMRPVFAWGHTIYNPHGIEITPELRVHEGIHGQRQGDNPEEWWRRYMVDPAFRLMEELLAHATEYRAYCDRPDFDRNRRRLVLRSIAQRLASPLYGSLISVADAKIAIATPDKPFRTRLKGSEQAA